LEVLTLLWSLLPAWRSIRWGPYYFIHYLRLVAGPSAWLYLAVAGMILGFVTTYFTFRFLPYASYTEPLLIDNLLGAMGFALYRILVPILATVLIAARCGAAVASDIGGKRYGRQLEAFQSLRVRPRSYLLTGELHAFLLGTPLLVAIAYFAASATSLAVFAWIHPELGPDYWRLHYHRELSVAGQSLFIGTGWLVAKLLVCAAGIALIAYHRGAAPKASPSDVSRAVTGTILWTTLYVLVVHFMFAFFEFKVTGGA
jgi:ABC-type transporter Mla maintaining outer membrane lipid asymmetry permease subunit MlaE